MKWTSDQQTIINKRNGSMLVSAAAGSGKTAVLTERIVALMETEGWPIDSFLIFTFTKAAAGEMKARLKKKLIERMKMGHKSPFFRDQLKRLPQAQISTVHSFCHTVVKRHFFILGLDPDFQVGDQNTLDEMADTLLTERFNAYYRDQDPGFISLVEGLTGARSDVQLKQHVFSLIRQFESEPDPKAFVDHMIKSMEDQDRWQREIVNHLAVYLEKCIAFAEEALELANLPGGPMVYSPLIEKELAFFHHMLEAKDQSFFTGLSQWSFERLPRAKSSDELDEDVKNKAQGYRNSYKDLFQKMQKKLEGVSSYQEMEDIYLAAKPMMVALLKIALSFYEELLEVHIEEKILSFSDLEHLAIQLLQKEEIAAYYQEKFSYIFVDEYQDSNRIQEQLVEEIKKGDNVFMVGDVKQSIYRFRKADPGLFLNKYKTYSYEEAARQFKIDLNLNFRSRANVLQSANELFFSIMKPAFGGIAYDEAAALYQGRKDFPGEDPPSELHLVLYEEEDKVVAECKEMAKRVKSLIAQGRSYRDICILFRSPSTYVKKLHEVFEDEGIPLFSDYAQGYLGELEVELLRNYLRVIDNVRQDIPLLGLMRLPRYQFTSRDFVEIRKQSPSLTFYEALKAYRGNEIVSAKIKFLLQEIAELRQRAYGLTIEQLIWLILEEYEVMKFLYSLPDGERRRANLRLMMAMGKAYQEQGGGTLTGFLRKLTRIEESSKDVESPKLIGEEANVVRLMSIHKSKGLEFPVVILGGLSKRFNLMDTKSPVLLHPDLGMAMRSISLEDRSYQEPVHKWLLSELLTEESKAEELRILYVAMTRAIDQLIMFGAIKKLDKLEEKSTKEATVFDLKHSNTYLDWILLAFSLEEGKLHTKASRWSLYLHEEDLSETQVAREESLEGFMAKMPRVDKLILEDNRKHHLIPAKVAVTAMSKGEGLFQVKVPALEDLSMKEADQIKATDLGKDIHKLLQVISLEALRNGKSLHEEVSRLIQKGYLRPELPRDFDMNLIDDFFKTGPGKKMLDPQAKVYREQAFVLRSQVQGQQVYVQGIIDCLIDGPGGIILIDYKTDQSMKWLPAYQQQLALYREALEALYGKAVVETHIHFLRLGKSVAL